MKRLVLAMLCLLIIQPASHAETTIEKISESRPLAEAASLASGNGLVSQKNELIGLSSLSAQAQARAQITLPDGTSVSGAYSFTPFGTNAPRELYDANDRLVARFHANMNTTLVNNYNAAGQLENITSYYGSTGKMTVTEYFYNAAGDTKSIKNTTSDFSGNNAQVSEFSIPAPSYSSMQRNVKEGGNVIEFVDEDGNLRRRETLSTGEAVNFTYVGGERLWGETLYRNGKKTEFTGYAANSKKDYALTYGADGISASGTRVFLYGPNYNRAAVTSNTTLSGTASFKGQLDGLHLQNIDIVNSKLRLGETRTLSLPDGTTLTGRNYNVPDGRTREMYDDQNRLIARVFGGAINTTMVYSYNSAGQNDLIVSYYPTLNWKTETRYIFDAAGNIRVARNTRMDFKGNTLGITETPYPAPNYDTMRRVVTAGVTEYFDSQNNLRRKIAPSGNDTLITDYTYYDDPPRLWSTVHYVNNHRTAITIYANGKMDYTLVLRPNGLGIDRTVVHLYGANNRRARLANNQENANSSQSYYGQLDAIHLQNLSLVDSRFA